jgi:signal transduction histidine kinase
LLVGFLLVTLGPACGLVWLGWRLLEQDRSLTSQRIQDKRERAADLAVTLLQQRLAGAEGTLPDPKGAPEADAVTVEFGPRGVQVVPKSRLLFCPIVPELPEPPAERFREIERLEFQKQDYAAAIEAAASLVGSPNMPTKAGAHLSIARNLRKLGQAAAALDEYAALAQCDRVAVRGVPATLLARRARCSLFSELKRDEELRREAAALYDDLRGGRWRLTRAIYDVHAEELVGWLGLDRATEQGDYALAEGAEWLWGRWRQEHTASGRASVIRQGRRVTILWGGDDTRVWALIAGPSYVERRWLSEVALALKASETKLALAESDSPAPEGGVLRAASQTGLPWTLVVTSSDVEAEFEQFAARRRLLLAGLVLIAILVSAVAYFIARTFTREMAVAQLQSDFVAAVSHEFRTPLTSLLQLSEAFSEDRPLDDARRRKYYQALERATRRLDTLVTGLLDFGRMEARAKVYRMEKLGVADLVSAVVDEFQRAVESRGYRVELHRDGDVPEVIGDSEAVGRAVWNLLDNAVKYSPDSKTVWLDVGRHDGRVAIRVRDRGLGISSAEQKEILKKFVRGSAAEKAGVKGTGIGLTMVQHIVRAHGGELRFESDPAGGTTFTILIPAMEK